MFDKVNVLQKIFLCFILVATLSLSLSLCIKSGDNPIKEISSLIKDYFSHKLYDCAVLKLRLTV
jgi:hypothetical protein